MRIKFIKSPAYYRLAYFVGDEAEFEDKRAKELIESGIAELVAETEKPKAEPKPAVKPKKGK